MRDLDLTPFRFLLDEIIRPARRYGRKMILPTAVPLMVCGVAILIAQWDWLRALNGVEASGSTEDLFAGLGGFLSLTGFSIIGYALVFCVLTAAAAQTLVDEEVAMGRAWLFVLRPATLGTLCLVGAVCALSVLMCVVPAFWVFPVLSLVIPVMVIERRFGASAISRSVEMIHFNPSGRVSDSGWLQMLALLFVGSALNYGLSLTVQLPFIVVQQVWIAREGLESGSFESAAMMSSMIWLQVPAVLLGALATAISWLYWAFGVSLMYREIRRRWEGRDLEAAIDEIIGAAA